MSYRLLTPEEIEDLRAEMRATGEWCKAELARRRQEHGEVSSFETTASPMTNGDDSDLAPGEGQV